MGTGHQSLMYSDNVQKMNELAQLLTSASSFPKELELQGKYDLLEGLRVTSEKMRSCSQTVNVKLA